LLLLLALRLSLPSLRTHAMIPLFRSAPRVTLVSTSCKAAAVIHDILVWRRKKKKEEGFFEEVEETKRKK